MEEKKMKKLISVIMAVAMMISMSVVSFAAESVTNLADFKAAIATGEVTLGADIVLDEQLTVETGTSLIINLIQSAIFERIHSYLCNSFRHC